MNEPSLAWETALAVIAELGLIDPVAAAFEDAVGPADLPPRWRSVATGGSCARRRAAAFALWPAEFVRAVPRFWRDLRSSTTDVRAVRFAAAGGPALLYLGLRPDRSLAAWVGGVPGVGEPPPQWGWVPAGVRGFLTAVHGGFTWLDGWTGGLLPGCALRTVAAGDGAVPVELPWLELGTEGGIDSSRLLRIGVAGRVELCATPDLPGDHLVLVDSGSVDSPGPWGPTLDDFLLMCAGR